MLHIRKTNGKRKTLFERLSNNVCQRKFAARACMNENYLMPISLITPLDVSTRSVLERHSFHLPNMCDNSPTPDKESHCTPSQAMRPFASGICTYINIVYLHMHMWRVLFVYTVCEYPELVGSAVLWWRVSLLCLLFCRHTRSPIALSNVCDGVVWCGIWCRC